MFVFEVVDLTEDKTYRFIVPKEGFSVKICGTGSGKPFLCYPAFKGDHLSGKCSGPNFCVIKADYLEDQKELQIEYGGGHGRFKQGCAVVEIEEKVQYGIDAKGNDNGTCQWKTDTKGMLAVDVTTAVGFTMTISGVTSVPHVNESAVPIWIYIIVGCVVLAILGSVAVVGYFLWKNFNKKPKMDKVTTKNDEMNEKNVPEAVDSRKSVRFEEENANTVGQSQGQRKT
uniref:Uncharacterized protein n=1 Tax=Panagrolaimus sp. JU765 TaxID=591449 RepID=A0AC34QFW4_9BILA